MAIPARKTLLKGLIDIWEAEAAPWGDCAFRYGPQHSWSPEAGEIGLCIVSHGPSGGERSAGSGNHWWQDFNVNLVVAVPDGNPATAGSYTTAEDLRADLWDQIEVWVHANRTLALGADSVKVAHVSDATPDFGPLFADDAQVFRMLLLTITYRGLRGG